MTGCFQSACTACCHPFGMPSKCFLHVSTSKHLHVVRSNPYKVENISPLLLTANFAHCCTPSVAMLTLLHTVSGNAHTAAHTSTLIIAGHMMAHILLHHQSHREHIATHTLLCKHTVPQCFKHPRNANGKSNIYHEHPHFAASPHHHWQSSQHSTHLNPADSCTQNAAYPIVAFDATVDKLPHASPHYRQRSS
eukprot:scaffold13885_cov23-Tisochrysis_lutea.AAC.6